MRQCNALSKGISLISLTIYTFVSVLVKLPLLFALTQSLCYSLAYVGVLAIFPALLVENGKFLLSAKRIRRSTYTEYVISMHADTISRSSNTYIGKIR